MQIDFRDLKATRDAYGHALLDLISKNKNIVVLDADLSRSTRTEWVEKLYPAHFYNMGIAEQNMMGVAAGLSMLGLIPFATTYAIFIGRAYDQIRQAIAFGGCNVRVVATHAGLAASFDGGSHQGIEDIALMRVIPGMSVLSPADYNEAYAAVQTTLNHVGPVYLRLQKENIPIVTQKNQQFEIGKAHILHEGEDIALIATGSMVAESLIAADLLAGQGVNALVLNVSTIKPLDTVTLQSIAVRCKRILTLEEHSIIGGLHEAVCTALAGTKLEFLKAIGIPDCFGDTGSWQELKVKFGLTGKQISECVLMLMTD